jgi:hypothetical protein
VGWEDSAPKPVMDTARDHLRAGLAAAGRAYLYDLELTSAEDAVECRSSTQVVTTTLPRAQAGKRIPLRLLREAVTAESREPGGEPSATEMRPRKAWLSVRNMPLSWYPATVNHTGR